MKSVLTTSSILIVLLAALRPLLRGRIDPRLQYALWLVAALVLVPGAAVGCTFTGAPEKSDPTTDNLQKRLMDLPEELQGTVTAVKGNGSMVEYRLEAPADWVDEHLSYVLSVHTFQKENFHGWPESDEDILWETAVQDNTRYYVIRRLREQTYPAEYEYWDTHRAVRTFVKETLLETEGMEPYTSQGSLRARLESIPEELRGKVALFHPDTPRTGKSDILATYLLDNTDPDWGAQLLTVRRLDHTGFEHRLHGTAGYTQILPVTASITMPSLIPATCSTATRTPAATA